MWGEERRRERERQRMRGPDDDRREPYRGRSFEDDGERRSFADPGRGRSYGPSGRYDDLSPGYRDYEADQRRIHRGDYDPGRYTPNAREGRDAESRSWWDRTQDEVSSWFGDEGARRRRDWDEHTTDLRAEHRAEHRGRGPKSYKRSDGRIHEDINDRLTDDPYVDAGDIEVSVKDGEATLSGFVSRRQDKRRAEDIAESVSGVKHVQNNLRVRPAEEIDAAQALNF
jgi:osmotically-inducible protein OsmY